MIPKVERALSPERKEKSDLDTRRAASPVSVRAQSPAKVSLTASSLRKKTYDYATRLLASFVAEGEVGRHPELEKEKDFANNSFITDELTDFELAKIKLAKNVGFGTKDGIFYTDNPSVVGKPYKVRAGQNSSDDFKEEVDKLKEKELKVVLVSTKSLTRVYAKLSKMVSKFYIPAIYSEENVPKDLDKTINIQVYSQKDFDKDPSTCKGRIPEYLFKSILTELAVHVGTSEDARTVRDIIKRKEEIVDLTTSKLLKVIALGAVSAILEKVSYEDHTRLYDPSIWKIYT